MKSGQKSNRPFLHHYIIECFNLSADILNNEDALLSATKNICNLADLTIVDTQIHKFTPIGITLVYILSESHFAVHTWPEKNYLIIDLLSCSKKIDETLLLNAVKKNMGKEVEIRRIDYEK